MKHYAYIGCRTTKERGARGKGINVFEINENGHWLQKQLVEDLVNPSFLCFDQNKEYLYTIHGDYRDISSFQINRETGGLTYINTVSTQGINPVHLSIDKSNQWMVRAREIAEPRHLVFRPDHRFCYGVNEKDYSVTCYSFDKSAGIMTPLQILPTLPSTYTGDGWASGIVMDDTGNFVIVSNRKHNSITCFQAEPETGYLTFADCVLVGGDQPRFITMSPTGNQVVVANELSDTIMQFEIEPTSGKLSKTDLVVKSESPVCVIFS